MNVENPIIYQTRLEQLEFNDQDEVVSGPLIDFYGFHILKGDQYYTTIGGAVVHAENIDRYIQVGYGLELHTKK